MSAERTVSPRWLSLGGLAAAGLLLTFTLAPGCGDDAFLPPEEEPPPEPTAGVEVTVVFPDDPTRTVVASLHLWALSIEEGTPASCSALIGGSFEPYDLGARTVADVASLDIAAKLTAAGVPLGQTLLYVEGVDYRGTPELAGCVAVEVVQPTTSATITLAKAKTFDCGDPATPVGSPCDDGELCTVGETCSGGRCDGGLARSCTHLADACNAESCDEELGCVATPIPDGTPCQDGLFCTEGDSCQEGACVGPALDCEATAPACQIAIGCDEASQACQYQTASDFTACDDGLFCTENDTCQGGFCTGTQIDCDTDAPTCQVAIGCDEDTQECLYGNAPDGSFCTDDLFCTQNEECSDGACVGTSEPSCTFLDGECVVGVCDEDTNGCVTEPLDEGVVCDDGLFCTTTDECDGAGTCAGVDLVCSGSTTCLPRVCNEVTNSCQDDPADITTPCDDADVCTENDECNGAGVCAGTLIPDCP